MSEVYASSSLMNDPVSDFVEGLSVYTSKEKGIPTISAKFSITAAGGNNSGFYIFPSVIAYHSSVRSEEPTYIQNITQLVSSTGGVLMGANPLFDAGFPLSLSWVYGPIVSTKDVSNMG